MPITAANGTELHYEVTGSGPPILLIMGATGEGAVFDELAGLLAAEFTVVTYDRRGNGRSAPPADWDTTSPEEQADDAAALLRALDLAPAAVFGTSSGGIFALATLLRHPQVVRAAVLHEPAFFALVDDPTAARIKVTEVIAPAMDAGGPTAAFQSFLRFAAGDATWERLDANVRERMLGSAGTYFSKEIGSFDTYLPDDQAVADIAAPVHLLVAQDSHPEFGQAAGRLAARLELEVTSVSGGHFGYVDHPQELAKTVCALLQNHLTIQTSPSRAQA
jgi:pimeloyl-ACP methyl ester carboxylesterase